MPVASSESLSQAGISFARDGTKRPQSRYHPASYRIALAKPTRRWPAELSEHDRQAQDGLGIVAAWRPPGRRLRVCSSPAATTSRVERRSVAGHPKGSCGRLRTLGTLPRRAQRSSKSRRIAWQRRHWPAGGFDGPDGPLNDRVASEPSEPRGDLSHARIDLTPRAVACPAGGSRPSPDAHGLYSDAAGRQRPQAHAWRRTAAS